MSQERLKVENEPIYRDLESGALIYTNKIEIQEYEKKKRKREAKENSLKTEINTIKQDVEDIKKAINSMIETITNKIKEG
jgi:hypothetical protein